MDIYRAGMKDAEGVAGLFDSYRSFYGQKPDLQGAATFIKERLESRDSVIFIVREGESYIGFAQLYPTFSSIGMKRAWILNDLYVSRMARKRGAGDMLLRKAREFAIQTGAKSISLSTAPDNHTARRLYEKNGYKQDTQFYHYELELT